MVRQHHRRCDECRGEHEFSEDDARVESQRRERCIGYGAPAAERSSVGVSVMMMMLGIAFASIGHLAHDRVVVAQHERRRGKRRHLADEPDDSHEPDVRTDTHQQQST